MIKKNIGIREAFLTRTNNPHYLQKKKKLYLTT